MHDKTIRRRRTVLVLLVAISLILLTDYFGESQNSPLHSIQRGIVTVLSPIQDGASKVLSPVRDITGWISSTIKAKSQNSQLRAENQKLATQVAADQYYEGAYNRDQTLLKLDNEVNLSQYRPIGADVVGKNSLLWYESIKVNRGSDEGVHVNDPVVGGGGLVGDVSYAGPNYAVVTLLTSPKFAVGAMVENATQSQGLVQPEVGNPSTLVLNYLPSNAQISPLQEVVTSGFRDSSDPTVQSLYPPGIPIGQVSTQNPQDTVLTSQQVQVRPAVNLLNLSAVQILTKPPSQ
ncbi:MAG TPA: rod shape-determining protein MreC [Solirubrobacteraceae bacterium]|nr:rod shape-determining protein MreC [Solirubrobacteraceae bacterium]